MQRILPQIIVPIGVLLLVASGPSGVAEVGRVEGFSGAQADAAAKARPLVVLVHGATWQGASRRILTEVWQTDAFRTAFREALTLTEISVEQAADEAVRQRFSEQTKGWDPAAVRTFPSIQIFSPDGRLLNTLAGLKLREAASSPDRLAAVLTARLTVTPPPPDVANWELIRTTTGRLEKGEAAAALGDVEAMLADEAIQPAQRCLLLAAKGMALAALDRTDEAWQAYRLAHAWDPDGVNGKAVIRHAYRTVGSTLRIAPSLEAVIDEGGGMANLTRDRATFIVMPPDPMYDRPADHASLFSGPLLDFAFHSANTAGPAILIDLHEACRIDVIQLVNRSTHQERAAGLLVWLSPDGKEWQPIWEAPIVTTDWMIDLRSRADHPITARYLKVGLPAERTGMLHLRAVNVFGSRLGDRLTSTASRGVTSDVDRLPRNTAITMQFDPSRIDLRAVAAYARSLLEADQGEPIPADVIAAATAVLKHTRPITWRSTTNERVKGTAIVMTPDHITIEHDGQRTEVDRKRFSAGSATVIDRIETAVRDFFQAVDAAKVTRPPASGDLLPRDQAAR